MSGLRFCLLLAVICSCSHLGQANDVTTQKTEIINVPPRSTETTVSAITNVEPLATNTTESSTTSSTTPSTTTSSTTPSTTTSSTTPSTTTSSTTPSTTTSSTTPSTTTVKPEPTPAPGPLPPPDQGLWSYTDKKTNVTCVVVQFAAQLNVTYTKANTTTNATSLEHVLINVPKNASVDGNCTDDEWLKLSWTNANATDANSLTIVYHKNDTTKSYGIKSLNISLTPDNFVNGSYTGPIELYHGEEWHTPLATSYRCQAPTQLNMSSNSVAATLTLSRLQEEAFRTTPESGFSAARECGGGDVPDAVPIAVGCALGGLVVVVLVAYLVGRRRSAARGYLSM